MEKNLKIQITVDGGAREGQRWRPRCPANEPVHYYTRSTNPFLILQSCGKTTDFSLHVHMPEQLFCQYGNKDRSTSIIGINHLHVMCPTGCVGINPIQQEDLYAIQQYYE